MKDPKPRFAFIDALRGVAALGVLLAHLITNEVSGETLKRIVPQFIQAFCHEGNFGVQVFFVLSGFVIALSLGQRLLTWKGAVNFMVRRELRLDPPYIVAMFGLASLHAFFGRGFPDARTIVLNILYLHNLVGAPQILGVAWTLCLEIQFYVAFLLILALDRWLGRSKDAPVSRVAVTIVWMTALISCYLVQKGTPFQVNTFGQYSWFYFASGVLCYWCWRGWAPVWTLGVVVMGMNASALWNLNLLGDSYVSASFEGIETAVISTLAIYALAGRGQLETLTLGKAGQFLGRISYSLYLTHAFTVEGTMWLTRAIWGAGPQGALIGLTIALPMVFLAAEGFYQAFEKPSVRLATKYKRI